MFVECFCTRKLAQRRSSLVNNSRGYRFLTTRYSRLNASEIAIIIIWGERHVSPEYSGGLRISCLISKFYLQNWYNEDNRRLINNRKFHGKWNDHIFFRFKHCFLIIWHQNKCVFNRFLNHCLIMITCISCTNTPTISLLKFINISPL